MKKTTVILTAATALLLVPSASLAATTATNTYTDKSGDVAKTGDYKNYGRYSAQSINAIDIKKVVASHDSKNFKVAIYLSDVTSNLVKGKSGWTSREWVEGNLSGGAGTPEGFTGDNEPRYNGVKENYICPTKASPHKTCPDTLSFNPTSNTITNTFPLSDWPAKTKTVKVSGLESVLLLDKGTGGNTQEVSLAKDSLPAFTFTIR